MSSSLPPSTGGAPIRPADLTLPTTQPIDLSALVAAQLPGERDRGR